MLFPPYIIRSQRQLGQEQLGLPAQAFRQVAINLSLLTTKLRRKTGKNSAKANRTCLKVASQLSFKSLQGGAFVAMLTEE